MPARRKTTGDVSSIDNRIRTNSEWSCLTKTEAELFNQKVLCRVYGVNETVFMEGDPCKGLYFVESGLVGVRKTDIEGQSALVRLAGPGDTLGYRPFLAKQSHRASAEVIEAAKVCFIDAQTARQLLHDNHELGLRFLERTARALGESEDRLFQLAALNVHVRVIHLLVLLHDRWGRSVGDGAVDIEIPLTRHDLASMVGARPETVSRAIRHLENEGLARFRGRNVHIEQFDRLAEELHANLSGLH
ncbi:MAG: Crp/Fnr family transcriptional regulator [Hyphomicrobiales bacterium]|nr:Crp/Fnr family transcriptional regulator [Hyphomicrobiales bacterium]MCP5374095.1 Crp/Fnr family transcriptional regulator [Hyphomicrobiales bacterium]